MNKSDFNPGISDLITTDELVESPRKARLLREYGIDNYLWPAMLEGFKAACGIKTVSYALSHRGKVIVGNDDLNDAESDKLITHVVLSTMANVHFDYLREERQSLQLAGYIKGMITGKRPDGVRLIIIIRDWMRKNKYGIENPIVIEEDGLNTDEALLFFLNHRLDIWKTDNDCTDEEKRVRIEYYVGKKRFISHNEAIRQAKKMDLPIMLDYSKPFKCLNDCEVFFHCKYDRYIKEKGEK